MKLVKAFALTALLAAGTANATPAPVYPTLLEDLFTTTIPKNNVQAGVTALAPIFLMTAGLTSVAKGVYTLAQIKKPLKNIYTALTKAYQKKYKSEFIKHPSEISGNFISASYVEEIVREEDGLWLAIDEDTLIPASQVKSFIKEECKNLLASAGMGISLMGLGSAAFVANIISIVHFGNMMPQPIKTVA